MNRDDLRVRLAAGVLVLDGAMGTQLIARGMKAGVCNDLLNVEQPHVVADVHRAYIQAGSDAVLTNTFGANRFVLGRHGLAERTWQINQAGAANARDAVDNGRYVLGDIGPCGDFLEPLGMLKPGDLRAAFAEQAEALVAGGVDGLIVETMTALDEASIVVEAALAAAAGRPVFASMSFDAAGGAFRTMMGVDVDSAVAALVSLGVDAVGYNCGTATLDEYVELTRRVVAAVRKASPTVRVLAEPNAGKPELVGDHAVYRVTAEQFAEAAAQICDLGVTIIGGCCGTTPDLIAALATRVG